MMTDLTYLFSHEVATASKGQQWIYGRKDEEFPTGGCFQYELLPPVPAQGELLLEKVKLKIPGSRGHPVLLLQMG